MWVLVAASPSREPLDRLAKASGSLRCQVLEVKVSPGSAAPGAPGLRDPLYRSAVELVAQRGTGSISMLQRVFEIGYNRAARMMEAMASDGVVGGYRGKGEPRDVIPGPGAFESVA